MHYNIWISKAICEVKYSHFKRSSATCIINFYCSHILFCNALPRSLLPKTIFSLSKLAPMYSKMHLHMTAKKEKRERIIKTGNLNHGVHVAKCSHRIFCFKFFIQISEQLCAYLRLYWADHSDLGQISNIDNANICQK